MDLVHKINSLRARPANDWLNAANHHVPPWSTGLLVVALAWYLAQLIWVLLPQNDEFDWSVRSPTPTSSSTQSSKGTVDFEKIASTHLFGVPGAEPVGPNSATVDAPETRMNLKLKGTVAADDPGMAHAIIADGKGSDDVYFVKDKIPGGAVLHEIYPDRVILNRSGSLETLRLPKLSEGLGMQSAQSSQPINSAPSARSMQSAMSKKGMSFTDILRPQPFMPNGELKGYRIYPGRDRRKFAALGFRPGDLVTEINGQALDNLQNGMEVFKGIASAPSLTVTIDRAGEPVVVSVDSSQLGSAMGTQ
jgi:general secretion pathway protein C